MTTDGVLFDLDGTLWDSCGVVAKSWAGTLRGRGLDGRFHADDGNRRMQPADRCHGRRRRRVAGQDDGRASGAKEPIDRIDDDSPKLGRGSRAVGAVEVVREVVRGQRRQQPNRLAPHGEAADAGIEETNKRRPGRTGRPFDVGHFGNDA